MLNHKTIKTIITITALCLISLARAGEKKPWEPELGKLDYDIYVPIEKERELYQMDIKQMTPKDGIWTGYVIAYGHFIKPPYKFEIVNDTMLFLNGVQIEPQLYPKKLYRYIDSIRAERAAKDPYQAKKDSICRAITTLDSIARVIYKQVYKSRGRDGAVDTVMKFFKAQDIIDSVSFFGLWENDGVQLRLVYPWPPGNTSYVITLRGPDFKPDTTGFYKQKSQVSIAERRTNLEQWGLNTRKKYLIDGDLIVIGGGEFLTPRGREYITKLYNILSDNKMSLEEKFDKLSDKKEWEKGPTFSSPPLDPKMLLYNFNPKEWSHLKELQGGGR